MRCLDPRQPGHELRQAVLDPQVRAIGGGVLADEIDLADSLREHARRLHHNRLEPAAAKLAAKLRNHAERAGMIAAFGDLDVSVVARGGNHARRQITIEIPLTKDSKPPPPP